MNENEKLVELLRIKLNNPDRLVEEIAELTEEEVRDLYLRLQLTMVPHSKRWMVTIVVNCLYVFDKIKTFFKKFLSVGNFSKG